LASWNTPFGTEEKFAALTGHPPKWDPVITARFPSTRSDRLAPRISLFLGRFSGKAVPFLEPSNQFVFLPGDNLQVIVG
jgi:hypothetical protein